MPGTFEAKFGGAVPGLRDTPSIEAGWRSGL
jgi:hypothetical protein